VCRQLCLYDSPCSPRTGHQTYVSYEELEADYTSGAVHPGDLKVRKRVMCSGWCSLFDVHDCRLRLWMR
jgi:hypothetical protein